jgi:hypothetical protein
MHEKNISFKATFGEINNQQQEMAPKRSSSDHRENYDAGAHQSKIDRI